MSFRFIALLHDTAQYVHHACLDGSSAFSHTEQCVHQLQNTGLIDDCILVRIGDSRDTAPVQKREKNTAVFTHSKTIQNSMRGFIECLCELSKDSQHLCVMFADSMISYAPLYEKMMNTHVQYHAHYTRTEGYPDAVAPEIISPVACTMLLHTLQEAQSQTSEYSEEGITRTSMFHLIEKRINDYDIEAILAPQDMRMLRISLSTDTRTNFTVSKRLWDAGVQNPDEILTVYHDKPQLFRSIPRYIYVQLTDAVQSSVYDVAYTRQMHTGTDTVMNMQDDIIDALFEKGSIYAEDAVLCCGFNGEVAVHPKIFHFLRRATDVFPYVYVETNGYEWDLQNDWWNAVPANIVWIVYLDAYSQEVHKTIRKDCIRTGRTSYEQYTQVHAFIEALKGSVCLKNIFVQATRMHENEMELDLFCKYWKQQGVEPILQKYNDGLQVLEDKKVVNVAPMKRFACRHLERDMVIDYEGNIRMCFQDINGTHIHGNIKTQSLEELWKCNESLFVNHVHGNYMEICRRCDEYYTCNI